MTDKEALRNDLRNRRGSITPAERDRAAEVVTAELFSLLDDVRLLGAFASHDNEIDLTGFYTSWLAQNRRLAFPRVVANGLMVFAEVTSLAQLKPGAYDIREPETPAIDATTIEAFLVPAVAFDRQGHRLGFGGGYYDRLLGSLIEGESAGPLRVGVGYSWQLLNLELPSDPWDVPVQYVVTDNEVCRAKLP